MKPASRASGEWLELLRGRVMALVRQKDRDLSLRQLATLLVCVDAKEPPTVRGLAEHLAISKPAVTRAVDRLEAARLVRRKPDLRDRRSVLIVPSRAGRLYYQQFVAARSGR